MDPAEHEWELGVPSGMACDTWYQLGGAPERTSDNADKERVFVQTLHDESSAVAEIPVSGTIRAVAFQ